MITEGLIEIGYSIMSGGFNGNNIVVAKRQLGEQLIGDHYVLNR